ncbi:hypothetical protein ADL12_47025 [Streptomyces regalis]|uniref:Uncharacterized protein n=1 Tax=Streptomyces regalis TaxID=68262 RepID=A0A117MJQ7_9ACTN|nr:hypothetical protein ADL12_47025 [Streptomyces regalis]
MRSRAFLIAFWASAVRPLFTSHSGDSGVPMRISRIRALSTAPEASIHRQEPLPAISAIT